MQLPTFSNKNTNISVGSREVIESHTELDILEYSTPYKCKSLYEDSVIDMDSRDYQKFVKSVERVARGSKELKGYIKYLKDNLDQDRCAIFNAINMTNASIELHHYPFSMYDITDIMIRYKMAIGEEYSTISLAKEIAEIHYRGMIGLVPLSKTVHELVHEGDIFIPLQWIHGNFTEFVKKYNAGMTGAHFDSLLKLIRMSKQSHTQKINQQVLKIRPTQWQLVDKGQETNTLQVFLGADEHNNNIEQPVSVKLLNNNEINTKEEISDEIRPEALTTNDASQLAE